jgi:hypothetical protein
MVDPEFELNRAIKGLTSKRKKTDEDLRQIEKLEWYGGLYEDQGVIVQPTAKVRKCLIETGKISKQGKMIERAISFAALYIPLVHDGPKDIDAVFANRQFHSRLSVGVGNKRVMRVRPQFYPWAIIAEGVFVEDVGLNLDELQAIMELAGVVVGIGDNRVNGYGRFVGRVKTTR